MSASEHLNKVLFHGTRHPFKEGELVTPANQRDSRNNYGYGEGLPSWKANYSYATESLPEARIYAESAHGQGEPLVYEVSPSEDMTEDRDAPFPEGSDSSQAWSSPTGFRVVRRVDY